MHSNNSPPKPPNINSVFKLDCNSSIAGPLLRILLLAICLLLSSLSLAIQAKPNGQHHNQQQQTNNRQIINSNQYGNQNTNQINHQLQHNSNHNNNNNINDSNNTNGHKYYGSLIGKLIGHKNNISGEVYAVDEQTLFIKSFSHDGQAQDAYFWSSVSSALPSAEGGFIVPDEKGSTKPLERYQNKDIVLRLPEGRTLREISWLSIWSRPIKFSVADIMIPQQLIIPRPLEISPLSQLAHGVKSGPITIVDAQTFLVPDFHYDGLGPAGYFWLTRGGSGLAANGLRLKDENGGSNPLRKYTGETVVISLPDELTVYDFDYFGVWCKEFQVNFGQTKIPQAARLPPSPKMLGIKPENKLNCEILYDDLGYEIRWVLDGDDIVMQLVGKIEPGEYMAFGLGKDDSKSDMKNADAVVTWVDRPNGQVHAIDYFLGSKAQCGAVATGSSSSIGSCPDVKLPNGGDSLTLLHGAIVNGYSMVTFKRPQLGIDELYDQHVYSDGQQSVLWAIGVLNGQKEIGYHRLHTKGNMFIDFARNPQWNCPIPDLNASMHNNLPITSASQMHSTVLSGSSNSENQLDEGEGPTGGIGSSQDSRPSSPASLANQNQPPVNQNSNLNSNQSQKPVQMGSQGQAAISSTGNQQSPWFIPSIVCPSDKTFFAQIGPTGGPKKGYEGLTGRPSWGVAWYINGLMAPELVLERGQSYKFVVEGGNDKTSTTRRHPLYLTDSPEGGFDFKTDEERQRERIFAGVALRGDGQFVPTAEGRLCELRATNVTLANPDNYPTFSAYQRTLKLDCLAGQASFLKFVPDSNTPDTIYYQCYTHRYMGWRIKVVDSCQAYVNSLAKSMMSSATSVSSQKKNNNLNKRSPL